MVARATQQERANNLLRLLDRYLGIPLILLLRLFKRKKYLPTGNIKSLGLLKTVAIGDTVLLSAIIRDLQRHYTNSQIVLFTGSSNYEFAKTIPDIRVVLLPVNHPFRSVRKIRSFRFDLFIDFGSWPRLDAILAFSARAGLTIGFKSAGQYRHYLFDRAVEHSGQVHEIENFRNLLRVPGVNSSSIPRIEYDENSSNLESDLRKPYVVFHPWPGGYKSYLKEWPPGNWSALAERVADMGLRILLSGSAADWKKSENIVKRMKSRGDQVTNIAGKYSLAETFGVIKNARLLVCVNTGIMHIGAALDVPMVALHGPTSPLRWGPLSDRAKVIVPDLPGCGYLNFGFEYPSNPPDCMGAISVEKVFRAVKSILNERDDSV